jgi:hypothetical protein
VVRTSRRNARPPPRHRVGDREQGGADRRAGQRQPFRRGARTAPRAEQVDHHEGAGRPGEGEPDVPGQRADAEHPDGQHDGRGGAGVDAEDARVGQRVAGERLHQRTGQAEGDPRGQADQRPRDAQVLDDREVPGAGRVGDRAVEGVPDRGRRDRLGADGDAQGGHQGQCGEREDQSESARGQPTAGPDPFLDGQIAGPLRRAGGHDARASFTIGTNFSMTYGVLSTELVENPLTRSASSMISSRPALAAGCC